MGGSWVRWFEQYDYPLGPPVADGVKGSDGIWTRTFESGTIVRFNSESGKGEISWASKPPSPTPAPTPTPMPLPPPVPTPTPLECTFLQGTGLDDYDSREVGNSQQECCDM